MIVSRFLLWARSATPGHRAEATAALAGAYLYSDLSREDRAEAETALTAMLDDTSHLVRRAMAEALASSPKAPRHLIVALAGDTSEIASIVLGRSPVLADCDLVDAAALGDERMQCAIAGRHGLSRAVSAAMAEIGTGPALVALASNLDAEIPDFSLARMVERQGEDGQLREALMARPDLPVDVTQAIATALSESLGRFVSGCGWLSPEKTSRVTREARERATLALSDSAAPDRTTRLVGHLREAGQLTPALILRAILSCGTAFAAAAFAELGRIAPDRAAAILKDERTSAFRALYGRAGMPVALRPAFEAALAANRDLRVTPSRGAGLSRRHVERALSACERLPPEEAGKLVALLRRFESEAAREEARQVASGLADRAALALVLEYAPDALAGDDGRMAA